MLDNNSRVDISLILNVHNERSYLLKTIMSLKEATTFAQSQGIVVELVVVLDRPDYATRQALNKIDLSAFPYVRMLDIDVGSPGLARNAGKSIAKGRYIQFCDGDDLISFNMLSAMFFEAGRNGEKTILFPEWIFAFGKKSHYTQYVDLKSITPLSFLNTHPYNARGFYSRTLCGHLDFSDTSALSPYAYEDWKFNCDALALGYDFRVVKDAILFYRQKSDGVLLRHNRESVKMISISNLFEPRIFLNLCKKTVEQLRAGEFTKASLQGRQYFQSPRCRLLTAAANRIDPEIDPEQIKVEEYVVFKDSHLAAGLAYYDTCLKLNGKEFAHVFLVPWVIRGGADQVLINIANTISQLQPDKQILVIMGQSGRSNEWVRRYSNTVTVIDLGKYLPSLGEETLNLLTLKILQALCQKAIIHLRTCEFAFNFFRKFKRILSDHQIVMYQFGNEIRYDGGFHFTLPFAPAFISENESYIDKFITDSEICASYSLARTQTDGKWAVLPTPCCPSLTKQMIVERAQKVTKRVLWASRITSQKRPQLLVEIAKRLLLRKPGFTIEAWGHVETSFNVKKLKMLRNVDYRGTYDSFETVASREFLCFIYTSYFDGIPTVVLEAAAAGLPIIAPDVGGIKEFVKNDETGIMIPSSASDEIMALSYVEAIDRLASDPEYRTDLAAQAYDRIVQNHSIGHYVKSVKSIFNI